MEKKNNELIHEETKKQKNDVADPLDNLIIHGKKEVELGLTTVEEREGSGSPLWCHLR